MKGTRATEGLKNSSGPEVTPVKEVARKTGSHVETESPLPAPAWAGTLFQGWLSIAVWMVVGLLLEGLMAYKTPAYLRDGERRELFRLAHTHGTFLGLVLIAAALCGRRFLLAPPRVARRALQLGASLMPVGFLLAGIWHYESDPGLAIWLVPVAALLLVFAVISFALASAKQKG